MSDTTKLSIAVCLSNAIITICFTALAVLFRHWWISLFGLLFFQKVEFKRL